MALAGEKNDIIFEQAQELFSNRPYQNHTSFDVNDFDVSFARGLSLEDGAATLTDLTAKIISSALTTISTNYKNTNIKILVAGGGRKNNFLMNKIKQNVSKKIKIETIDNYGVDGDFVESQAFCFFSNKSNFKITYLIS